MITDDRYHCTRNFILKETTGPTTTDSMVCPSAIHLGHKWSHLYIAVEPVEVVSYARRSILGAGPEMRSDIAGVTTSEKNHSTAAWSRLLGSSSRT